MSLPDVNADLDQPAIVRTASMEWESSPSGTVWRKPLYRQGGEYGPVTSVVRYKAGGTFASHYHPQGEEILVLEGIFSDEYGDYCAGTYLLNPDGSHHAPFSREGCTLLVRLRQYEGKDRSRIVLDTTRLAWSPGIRSGLSVKPLYRQSGYPEEMALVRWEPGALCSLSPCSGGAEIFILAGMLQDKGNHYPAGTWLRQPPGSSHTFHASVEGFAYIRLHGPLEKGEPVTRAAMGYSL
jgi:anti-sigma factor ChrR (cupin superfamily)